ncbi:MAG: DUF933 domain-containing protein [bacterium]
MKIYFSGIALSGGKIKYRDERLEKLDEKFKPKKVGPFFPEFIISGPEQADAIAVTKDKLIDILIPDMEKFESRISKSVSGEEKKLAEKCLASLGEEKPLCDIFFSDEERTLLAGLAPLSFKPVVIAEKNSSSNNIIAQVLKKAGIMFFYTVGKDECKAWPAEENSDALTCAGKIHSDLAKGFIKADVINYNDLITVYNMREAGEKGLVKTVGRDYIIRDGDIIEIRFNVSKKT